MFFRHADGESGNTFRYCPEPRDTVVGPGKALPSDKYLATLQIRLQKLLEIHYFGRPFLARRLSGAHTLALSSNFSGFNEKPHAPYALPLVSVESEGEFDSGGQGFGTTKPDAIHRLTLMLQF